MAKGPQVDFDGFGDALLYFGLAAVMVLLTAVIFWFTKKSGSSGGQGAGQEERQPVAGGGNRRQGAGAGAGRRGRGRRVVDESDSDGGDGGGRAPAARRDSDDSDHELDDRLNDPKLGAKKRAKLEAKAEKKLQREAEERMREDKKARQIKDETDRKLREEQDIAAEKKREEDEKRAKEEQAQRELEEYLKMKEAFSVEEEGCEVIEEEEEGNLIEMFLDHIKRHKVVMFDELASKFGLKVPDTIDRLKVLVEEGRLTGVMDDRGKFIYISQEELERFAKFIKQRGRVQISELVENSSTLINLTPVEAET
ncbi:DDRGK domain-containing protein 1 [Folsomia candida]|uniref:DDRGK domain-containing protein 1 n=1 Tax=Folsomia candida TaxID=158441 RepID=A0A226DNF4_FOLCA|nr:DDRGK domain-containing protein 1 [Folsomia candida]OXA45756.1 DDRGK domain-containing protein 1 [Folsomia candida]